MKRLIRCCKYEVILSESRKSGIGRVILSRRVGTSVASDASSDDDVSYPDKLDSTCIVQYKDLLTRSQGSGCGLYILDLINSGSLQADRDLYSSLVKKCTELKKLKEGRLVHHHLENTIFKDDIFLQNHILNLYSKCGSLGEARELFDKMAVKDMVSWTTLITGYSQDGQSENAIALFPEMLAMGFEPNEFTFSSTLKASGNCSNGMNGRQIHAYCLKWGYLSNVYVGSSLVDMYARHGQIREAQMVFDSLACKNEVSWNALIAAHARRGDSERALYLFSGILRNGLKPTHFTYSSLFGALSATGSLEQGKWVHAHLIKSGGQLIAYVGNTLVDMYAKSGSIEDMEKAFNRLLRRDVVSWNSLLNGYALHGKAKECVKKFEEMLKTGTEPTDVTFLCVLSACSHAGLLDKGQLYFNSIEKYKLEPRAFHYVAMVDLLGRAGRLQEAERFIKEMPIEPTAEVWGALMSACKMHKNLELGAYAAEKAIELDPVDSGPHVILSNIYASAGRWGDVARVRKVMKSSGVKKEPACSWVEIENRVHMFVANDDAHPQKEEIRTTWEDIHSKIKAIGYVPDTSSVLFFADEQEREQRLQQHSEKLALAFSVLNTPANSTIRIKKNLRVCSDCHSAFKFASKVLDREISLRDTNRFHHFRDGSCSCGDYW
ncbi:hypothetical protein MLD38_028037 [Melastoma candidum]|uniref:Uncharacterized protein n=1 Tax=Melastoma candidum TaxID=119954 RepID=A0ACB9MZX6_9MYRT|nr:hypothetical protein MLD38_028037 [Melastoma candidum]